MSPYRIALARGALALSALLLAPRVALTRPTELADAGGLLGLVRECKVFLHHYHGTPLDPDSYICSDFARDFAFCVGERGKGLRAEIIDLKCNTEHGGHAFNGVRVAHGKYCFVEPQANPNLPRLHAAKERIERHVPIYGCFDSTGDRAPARDEIPGALLEKICANKGGYDPERARIFFR